MEEEQIQIINKILSYIYLGFNFVFTLFICKSLLNSTTKGTKSLKIRLLFLIIIDSFNYISCLIDLDFLDELIIEIIIKVINSLQIYLIISIFKKIIGITKLKKMGDVDHSLHSYQIALLSFILIFSYQKVLKFDTKIIIIIQNLILQLFVYIFYKSLYNPVLSLLKNLNKKYVAKIQTAKNLKLLLNLSVILIYTKAIMNIIFIIFLDDNYRDFLAMPLNVIIYLKYFDFTLLYLLINQLEKYPSKKRREDDTLYKLKSKKNFD